MKHFLSLIIMLMLFGCATSEVNYQDFPVKPKDQIIIAKDLAWVIKEKYGADSVFNFNYSRWNNSSRFAEELETELRKLGVGVYVNEPSQDVKYDEMYFTLSKLNNSQFYIRVVVNNKFSFQRIWVYNNDELHPLTTTSVFEG